MTGPIRRMRRFLKDQRAVAAPIFAALMTVSVGLVGGAVDLGMVYSARNELQNAADAAALAGANTLVAVTSSGEALAEPDTAISQAQSYSAANESIGVSLSLPTDDITIGYWDFDAGDFDPDRTGPSTDPDDLTAMRVTLRRDSVANTPVSTFFSRIFGLDEVEITASAVGFLGWVGSMPAGEVDLPIAVSADAVSGDGDSPNCGTSLTFHSENVENASWTTFLSWPTNDVTIRRLMEGSVQAPPLSVGEDIAITNGNLSVPTFEALYQRFHAVGQDFDGDGLADYWEVQLPVIEAGYAGASSGTVVGFMTMVITGVQNAPGKFVTGYLKCGMVELDSIGGGDNYGMRATRATLIR